MGRPQFVSSPQYYPDNKGIFEFFKSVHTGSLMAAGKQTMKIAWLVYGRKVLILFSKMSAGDREETLENRSTWFQIKYLH